MTTGSIPCLRREIHKVEGFEAIEALKIDHFPEQAGEPVRITLEPELFEQAWSQEGNTIVLRDSAHSGRSLTYRLAFRFEDFSL